MKLQHWILTIIFSSILFVSAIAQWLPDGAYHPHREREIDLLHYQAEISFEFETKTVFGTSIITLRPLSRKNSFSLDAIRLEIHEVILAENQPLKFGIADYRLNITLDQYYTADDTINLTIRYSAQPNAGMYFLKDKNKAGQYFVHTYGEGGLHANWLPIYNDVDDKFTTEMIVTAPQPYTVISNGSLSKVDTLKNGDLKFRWQEDLPFSNYLIALYVGEYEKGELRPASGTIPIHYWVPVGRKKDGAYAFQNTPKMVEFFSKLFDYPYPWHKYDQVATPDYAIGAMEHHTVTGFKISILRDESAPVVMSLDFDRYHAIWSTEGIISHELAHHWFGNNVTCRNLNYLWLNESFATYCQFLWEGELFGEEMLLLDKQEAFDLYLQHQTSSHIIRPLEYPYYDTISETYNLPITYFKGAAILHTLRNILGDEDFFRVCSYYLHKHQFSNVVTTDFKQAIEEVTGKDLNWFFNDWVYGGGHPIFEVSYTYLKDQKLIDLTVEQIQPIIEGQDLFTLPVEIAIATSQGIKQETIWLENKIDQFLLECDEKPLMVSFDGQGALVAEVRFDKSLAELLYQLNHDEFLGRFWALREMARRFPVDKKSVQAIADILSSQSFWGLKAEAALLLGKLRTPEAESVILKALEASEYRIRKAAVIALANFRAEFAEPLLKNKIRNDPQSDVVAAAIVALAKTNPAANIAFIHQQMNRPAWCDEIKIACLNAFGIISEEKLVPYIKPCTAEKYLQHVRDAALHAWKSCAPTDPDLHRTLMEYAENAPYELQYLAVSLLGTLHVEQAIPLLENIARDSGDHDLRIEAEQALAEIRRIF